MSKLDKDILEFDHHAQYDDGGDTVICFTESGFEELIDVAKEEGRREGGINVKNQVVTLLLEQHPKNTMTDKMLSIRDVVELIDQILKEVTK